MTVINNSNMVILCELDFDYPDTSLHEYGHGNGRSVEIDPGSKERFSMPGSWESEINHRNSLGISSFFIVSLDTISKYGWETVRQTYNILERRDMTVEDLKNNNWTLNYP